MNAISPHLLTYILSLISLFYYASLAPKHSKNALLWAAFGFLFQTGLSLLFILFSKVFIALFKILSWPINDYWAIGLLLLPLIACVLSLKLAPSFVAPQAKGPAPSSSNSDILDADI